MSHDQALRDNEELYRQIVEMANGGIWSLDHEMRATFFNSRFADMLGYTPEGIQGRPIIDFISREDHKVHAEKM